MDIETEQYLKTRQKSGLKKSRAENEPDGNGHNTQALLLDASGAADLLGFTRQYFYQMQSSGRLGPLPIKFGQRSRWSRFELKAWVECGCPARDQWQAIKDAGQVGA